MLTNNNFIFLGKEIKVANISIAINNIIGSTFPYLFTTSASISPYHHCTSIFEQKIRTNRPTSQVFFQQAHGFSKLK